VDTVAYDVYTETDQLEYEFTLDFAETPQAGDTIDYQGVLWKVERRHFSRDGKDICVVVSRLR
jgi:hypothetical protein